MVAGDERDNGELQHIATLSAPDVHSLLIDPNDSDHIYFGSHAGLQESHDGGKTWEAGTLRNVDVMQMAASPAEPETYYATGHDVYLVSHDGGSTWSTPSHDLPGIDLHGFAQNLVEPEQLYTLVVGAGMMASRDAGATWTPIETQPPAAGGHVALAAHGESLYATTESGIVVSNDGGTSWTALASSPSAMVISLAISPSDPDVIYAGTQTGLQRTIDGGASWEQLGGADVPVVALAVDPNDAYHALFVSDSAEVYEFFGAPNSSS